MAERLTPTDLPAIDRAAAEAQTLYCDGCGQPKGRHLEYCGEPAYERQVDDEGRMAPDRCGEWVEAPPQPLVALVAAQHEVYRLTHEVKALREEHERRTACMIVAGGRALACSRVLRGDVEGESEHGKHDLFDFAFYKVREETSINNHGGHTTRPPETKAYTRGTATCPKCAHTWESALYSACGASHHWPSGPCPNCAYAVGAGLSHCSSEGPAIEVRYRTEVQATPATEGGRS
ncbi:MAG: hypothetical protein A3F76_08295 [Burkholderiales bacterium RIFCSPLOWO2_12_FULL_65_40]|nr:MAG: hypothetical protein A3F76_08295 [Burkholderiales bacterium RIFCSPLOWO2_12_FULL_65_40]